MNRFPMLLALFYQIMFCALSAPFPHAKQRKLQGNSSSTNIDACEGCLCYVRDGKLYVDCSQVIVFSLPTNMPLNTSRLLLGGQQLTDIGYTNFLPPLPELRVLHLNFNPIQRISVDAFQNVTHLKTLLLHFTNITELPDGLFANMTNLKYLWLNNANIKTVGPTVFHGLEKLKSLRIQENFISEFADGQFYNLPKIQELDIRNQRADATLESTCCTFCGIHPDAVDFDHINSTAQNISSEDYVKNEMRCGA